MLNLDRDFKYCNEFVLLNNFELMNGGKLEDLIDEYIKFDISEDLIKKIIEDYGYDNALKEGKIGKDKNIVKQVLIEEMMSKN